MKKHLTAVTFFIFSACTINAQTVPNLDWVNNLSERDDRENIPQAIDLNGNVYTIGYSNQAGNRNTTIQKINPAGTTLWVQYYNGTGNGDDRALAIKLGPGTNGDIYICGSSEGIGSGKDFITIKYNSAGVQQWVQRYNGAGNFDDIANCIELDNAGNVYVAGRSTNASGNFDCLTIKYNSSGVQQWIHTHNGTANGDDRINAIGLGAGNRLYIAGHATNTGTFKDIVTFRLNTNTGAAVWSKVINGPGNKDDMATGLVPDGNDVEIIGTTFEIGEKANYYFGDLNGNAGTVNWENFYDGYGEDDVATAVVKDNVGNTVVTGISTTAGLMLEYHTVKYNSSGVQQWVSTYNRNMSVYNVTPKIAIDQITQHLYVCGETNYGTANVDVVLYQISPSGNQTWTEIYNGNGNGTDVGVDLSLSNTGDIYVAAQTANMSAKVDMTTLKYSQTRIHNNNSNNQRIADFSFANEISGTGAPELFLFPNPASSSLNVVRGNPNSAGGRLTIYNSIGEIVAEKNSIAGTAVIDVSTLCPGVYFVQLRFEELVVVRRFVKE
jgi:hypothetical protein